MSVTFTKLFSSITASTVWCESSDTRVVWITMLAMADKHGRVWASIPGLAKEAAVPLAACRVAIDKFLSPDPDSRTKVKEGRRIEPIDGGWRLINHAKYRAIRDEEERRAYKAEKQKEYRSVDKVDKCGHSWTAVDLGGHNAEAEAYTEADFVNSESCEVDLMSEANPFGNERPSTKLKTLRSRDIGRG
jgi:hypothetical protein